MKKQLVNGDFVEIILKPFLSIFFAKIFPSSNTISTLNVSRDMNNCSNPICLVLTNGGFFVFWLSKIDGGNEIYGRRYTAQGLAGKIIKFRILHLSSDNDITVELKKI